MIKPSSVRSVETKKSSSSREQRVKCSLEGTRMKSMKSHGRPDGIGKQKDRVKETSTISKMSDKNEANELEEPKEQ